METQSTNTSSSATTLNTLSIAQEHTHGEAGVATSNTSPLQSAAAAHVAGQSTQTRLFGLALPRLIIPGASQGSATHSPQVAASNENALPGTPQPEVAQHHIQTGLQNRAVVALDLPANIQTPINAEQNTPPIPQDNEGNTWVTPAFTPSSVLDISHAYGQANSANVTPSTTGTATPLPTSNSSPGSSFEGSPGNDPTH